MTRRSSIVVTVVFLAVIALPLVLFVSGVRPEVVDNRAATEWPGLGGSALVERDTYEVIDTYLVDRLPLRDRAVRLEAEIEQATSVFETVRTGEPSGTDGWLYLPDTLDDSCDQPDPAGFLRRVDETAEQAEAAGIPFVFLVVPNKAQVYPEHLPPIFRGDGAPECPAVWRAAVEDAVQTRPWMLDLFPALDEAARTSSEPVYYQTDTHWTDFGALIGVEALLSAIAPDVWDPNEATPAGDRTGVRDLTRLLGLSDEETVPAWKVARPGVRVEVLETGVDNSVIRSRATSSGAPLVPGTTVFVGDSFGVHEIRHLQPYFEDLAFIKMQYLDNRELADVVGTRPDTIVVQIIARNLVDGMVDTPLARIRSYLAAD